MQLARTSGMGSRLGRKSHRKEKALLLANLEPFSEPKTPGPLGTFKARFPNKGTLLLKKNLYRIPQHADHLK